MEAIIKHGWMITSVFPDQENDITTFSYTSGVTMLNDHPELVVTGLDPKTAGTLLNALGDVIRKGRQLCAGEHVEHILDGYSVRLIEADPDNNDYPMSMARRFFPSCTALQMLWPDKHGAFPDSSEYSLNAASQPMLPRTLPE